MPPVSRRPLLSLPTKRLRYARTATDGWLEDIVLQERSAARIAPLRTAPSLFDDGYVFTSTAPHGLPSRVPASVHRA